MKDDPRPNSPEDVGGTQGYMRPVRRWAGADVPPFIDGIDKIETRCRGARCRVLCRWAFTRNGGRVLVERRLRKSDGAEIWELHDDYCPDAGSFGKRGKR